MKLERDDKNPMRPKSKSRYGHAWDSHSYPWIYYSAKGDVGMRPQIGEVETTRVYAAA